MNQEEIKHILTPADEYIIKLVPASDRHSVPIYAPKKWEGKRVLLLLLEEDTKR